tara:strand:+ start:269 stop:415 length:147 start_codon:yes stop_codon:yes gene_type:complete
MKQVAVSYKTDVIFVVTCCENLGRGNFLFKLLGMTHEACEVTSAQLKV